MRLVELFRTTAFRWSLAAACAFALLSLLLFIFVYWQTAGLEQAQLDEELDHERRFIAEAPLSSVAGRVRTWLQEDLHSVRYAVITGPNGDVQAGNLLVRPPELLLDGRPQDVATEALDKDNDERREIIRALGITLIDGRTLVLGHDTDEVNHIRAVILRALCLGLLPMIALALTCGVLLGRRALDRVAALEAALANIREGRLSGRLPVAGTRDEFDRLSYSVNAMMDEIERLLAEVRGVGDSIAHDLRTPLTRARSRLEGSRAAVNTEAEFTAAIDEALAWLDQTFAIITAILRIGEIEHGLRKAAFRPVDLAPLVTEAAELYDPIAEEQGILLRVEIEAKQAVTFGDRDLLFEAITNLVDNALKFTPAKGNVRLSLVRQFDQWLLVVADDGPGIPAAERGKVLKRFYRSERSRHHEGSGLGLSLVSAVAGLHGFKLSIDDNRPGCRITLSCPA